MTIKHSVVGLRGVLLAGGGVREGGGLDQHTAKTTHSCTANFMYCDVVLWKIHTSTDYLSQTPHTHAASTSNGDTAVGRSGSTHLEVKEAVDIDTDCVSVLHLPPGVLDGMDTQLDAPRHLRQMWQGLCPRPTHLL